MTVVLLAIATAPSWVLAAGGDLMLNGIVPGPDVLGGLAPALTADVAYANLEVPLTVARTATRRKSAAEIRARSQFVLKADPGHAPRLAAAGVDVVSLGNNHAMDYGPAGLRETLTALSAAGILAAGAGATRAQAAQPAVFTLPCGFRVGLLSALCFVTDRAAAKCWPATDSGPGVFALALGGVVGPRQRERIRALVASARERCDALLFAAHWGDERQTQPKPYQVALGRALLDEGVDAVLGAHPHVLQPVEVYRGKPLLYSLGNLVSPLPGETAVYRLRFQGRRFVGLDVVPVQIAAGRARPMAAPAAARARRKIAALDDAFQGRFPHRQSRTPAQAFARRSMP